MKTEPATFHAIHLAYNPWLVALAASPFALALLALGSRFFVPGSHLAALSPHLFIGGVIASVAVWNNNPYARRRQASVRVSELGVQILYGDGGSAGRARLPRAELKSGFLVPSVSAAPRVRLTPHGLRRAIDLEVDDEQSGRRLLRALSFDVSQTTATFRVGSRMGSQPWMGFLVAAVATLVGMLWHLASRGRHHGGGFLPMMFIVWPAMLVLLVVPSRLDVGVDGVLLRWLWTRRFIGYGEVVSVAAFDEGSGKSRRRGVCLSLEGGEQVRLIVNSAGIDDRIAILKERIRGAMEAHAAGGGEEDAMLLRRGDRSVGEWIRSLRSIGAGANADLRTAPVAPERLWRIVESPSVKPSARAAAATALGASVDEEGRDRLRAAAAATVAPKLRIALEAAAGEAHEEGAFEEALRELEAAEAKEQRSLRG